MNLHRSVRTGEAARRRELLEAEARRSKNAADLAGALVANVEEAVGAVAGASIGGAVSRAILTRISQRKAPHTRWDSLSDADLAQGGIGLILSRMRAYAYYGIALCGDRTADERRRFIRHHILFDVDYVRDLAEGVIWWTGVEDILSAAEGRWVLDHAEPIHPRALANLGGVSERHIRKMMWEVGTPFTDMQDVIPAEPAMAWLLDRTEEFYPSIWVDQDPFDDLPAFCAPDP